MWGHGTFNKILRRTVVQSDEDRGPDATLTFREYEYGNK